MGRGDKEKEEGGGGRGGKEEGREKRKKMRKRKKRKYDEVLDKDVLGVKIQNVTRASDVQGCGNIESIEEPRTMGSLDV